MPSITKLIYLLISLSPTSFQRGIAVAYKKMYRKIRLGSQEKVISMKKDESDARDSQQGFKPQVPLGCLQKLLNHWVVIHRSFVCIKKKKKSTYNFDITKQVAWYLLEYSPIKYKH